MIVIVIISILIALLLYGGNIVLIKRKPLNFNWIYNLQVGKDKQIKQLSQPDNIDINGPNAPKPSDLKCYFRDNVYNYKGNLKKAGSEIKCIECNQYYYKAEDSTCLPMGFDKLYNRSSCDNSDVRSSCLKNDRGVCSVGEINSETDKWTIDVEPKSCPN